MTISQKWAEERKYSLSGSKTQIDSSLRLLFLIRVSADWTSKYKAEKPT